MEVVVEGVADHHGVLDAGGAVVGEASDVMRSEISRDVFSGASPATADAGAAMAVLDQGCFAFEGGEGAPCVDSP